MSKKMMLLFLAIISSSKQASATRYKGYSGNYKIPSMTLTESVSRFVETEKEFLILLSRHAAFYRFPKKQETSSDVRSYLKKLVKSKERIQVEMDPISTEIKVLSSVAEPATK